MPEPPEERSAIRRFIRTWIWDWKIARWYFWPVIIYTVLVVGAVAYDYWRRVYGR